MLTGTGAAGEQLPKKGSKGGTALNRRRLKKANDQPWLHLPPVLRAAARSHETETVAERSTFKLATLFHPHAKLKSVSVPVGS